MKTKQSLSDQIKHCHQKYVQRDKKKRERGGNKPSSPTSESMPKLLAGGKADNVQMELDSSVRGLDAPHIKMERRGGSPAATWSTGKSQITESPSRPCKVRIEV